MVRPAAHDAHAAVARGALRGGARAGLLAGSRRRSRGATRGDRRGAVVVASAARARWQHVLAAVDVLGRPRDCARAASQQRSRRQALRRGPRGRRSRLLARVAAHGLDRRRPRRVRDRRARVGWRAVARACTPSAARAHCFDCLLGRFAGAAVRQQGPLARRPAVASHGARRRRRLGPRRQGARARLERDLAALVLPDQGRRPDLRAHRLVVPDDDPEQGSAAHQGVCRAHQLRTVAVRARSPSALPGDRCWRRARNGAREGTRRRARHGSRDQPGHRRSGAGSIPRLRHGRDRARRALRAAQRRRPQLRARHGREVRQPDDHVHPDRRRERLRRVRAVRSQPVHSRSVRRVPRQARAGRRVLRLSPRRRRMPAPCVDGGGRDGAPRRRGLAIASLPRAQLAQRSDAARRPLAVAQR